jgi:site-specific DNA-methyltransferase (adenine-specific)
VSECRIIEGDCLQVLPTLEAGSFDAVITDPPYGLGFPYHGYSDTRDNLRALIAVAMPELRRVARSVYVLPGITQVALYPEPDWIACVCWDTTGSHGKYGFTQWMPVLCYGEDLPGFARLDNGMLKSDVIAITGGGGVGFRRPAGEKTKHPCPKPLNVMRVLVRRLVREGGAVLDPFAGIGTTLVAAMIEGRRFVGIEQSPEYAAIARRRIADTVPPLFAGQTPGLFAEATP